MNQLPRITELEVDAFKKVLRKIRVVNSKYGEGKVKKWSMFFSLYTDEGELSRHNTDMMYAGCYTEDDDRQVSPILRFVSQEAAKEFMEDREVMEALFLIM